MRKVLIAGAIAAIAIATPAAAGEGRAEVRGGVAWANGTSDEAAGAAIGYDFNVGTNSFAGVEVSADTFLDGGATDLGLGFTGRAGARVGAGKFYALAGYTTEFCDPCGGAMHAGTGYQHSFGKLYAKVEYRRYFHDAAEVNVAGVGLGFKFH